jgi:hypothetical protein
MAAIEAHDRGPRQRASRGPDSPGWSIRRRPVLSTQIFIGRQLLRRASLELPMQALDLALAELRALIMAAVPA